MNPAILADGFATRPPENCGQAKRMVEVRGKPMFG
jgi:hypothetical protein